MPITSGSIEYERRLNLGEYNHKNIVAKVSWTIEPGEDDRVLADQAVAAAITRVYTVLNCAVNVDGKPVVNLVFVEPNPEPKPDITRITVQDLENLAAPNLAAQHAAAEITAGIPPSLKRHRRTKAEMEAARAAQPGPTVDPSVPSTSSADPAPAPEPANPTPSSVTETRSDPPNEPGMPSFDPDPPKGSAEVTDQALLDACQAKASSGKPVDAIRELVASFSPGGLVQTPQDARRRFLDELAKL